MYIKSWDVSYYIESLLFPFLASFFIFNWTNRNLENKKGKPFPCKDSSLLKQLHYHASNWLVVSKFSSVQFSTLFAWTLNWTFGSVQTILWTLNWTCNPGSVQFKFGLNHSNLLPRNFYSKGHYLLHYLHIYIAKFWSTFKASQKCSSSWDNDIDAYCRGTHNNQILCNPCYLIGCTHSGSALPSN